MNKRIPAIRHQITMRFRALNAGIFTLGIALAGWIGVRAQQAEPGMLLLQIVDEVSGQPTPARVEVLDKEGNGYVAEDALLVGGDPKDRDLPWSGTVEDARALLVRRVTNPYTKKIQFYSHGSSRLRLPPGSYRLQVTKGYEFKVQRREVDIQSGGSLDVVVKMPRWIDVRPAGWYSADNHLHIARSHRELDPFLSKWMQAEDLHVATFLQWGNVRHFHNTLQYVFGPDSVYREGDYLIASGQENPRTHILGHTIILGGSGPINFPDQYLIYRMFWEEAQRQGAVSGYAHNGILAGAMNGLSIDLPLNLLSFIEVLQFQSATYDVWYNILNTGFRIAPSAGSDYPFGPILPGRERFYARVEGPLTYEKWLDSVRRGRTFVSNGPLLEFRVHGREIGDDLLLKKPGRVRIEARVRFDPDQDDVKLLEVIENGRVLRSFVREGGASEIQGRFDFEAHEAGWLALRASGDKLDTGGSRPALAHTGAIYIEIENASGRSAHPRAKALARAWAVRLQDLKARLGTEVDGMGISTWDEGVSSDYLRKSIPALVKAIDASKQHFLDQAK